MLPEVPGHVRGNLPVVCKYDDLLPFEDFLRFHTNQFLTISRLKADFEWNASSKSSFFPAQEIFDPGLTSLSIVSTLTTFPSWAASSMPSDFTPFRVTGS